MRGGITAWWYWCYDETDRERSDAFLFFCLFLFLGFSVSVSFLDLIPCATNPLSISIHIPSYRTRTHLSASTSRAKLAVLYHILSIPIPKVLPRMYHIVLIFPVPHSTSHHAHR